MIENQKLSLNNSCESSKNFQIEPFALNKVLEIKKMNKTIQHSRQPNGFVMTELH